MATNRERFGKRLPGPRQRDILGLIIAAHEAGFEGAPLPRIERITGNRNAWRSIAPLIRIGVLHILPSGWIAIVDPPPEVLEPQRNVIEFRVARNRKMRRQAQDHSRDAPHAA